MEREVDVGLGDGGGVLGFECDCVYGDGGGVLGFECDCVYGDGGGVLGFECDCVYGDGVKCVRFYLEIWSCGNDSPLSKRYTQVLFNLTPNPGITISPADKNGGVVIIHKQRYVNKFNSFLEGTNA